MNQSSFTHYRFHYRPDIDGLRAVAVLLVVGFHFFPELITGGFIGVDVFFVISGYLIGRIIFNDLVEGYFSFKDLYIRRIRRIFPSLGLVLLASMIFGWFVLFDHEYEQLGKHIATGVGFVSNFMLWHESGYFDEISDLKPLVHLWSLGVEEQFYIFSPILFWMLFGVRRLCAISVVLGICALSFLLNILYVSDFQTAVFYSPLTRMWELLLGCILGYIHFKKYYGSRCAKNTYSIIGSLLLLSGAFLIDRNSLFPGLPAIIPVVGTIFIIAGGGGKEAFLNNKVYASKVLIWIGLISFPLYLWHWPLISFYRIIEGGLPPYYLRMALIALAVILAYFTYRYLELPIRRGFISSTKFLIFVLIIIGGIGACIYLFAGFSFRDSTSGYKLNQKQLTGLASTNKECLKLFTPKPYFPVCIYDFNSSDKTIAIIGDSHAQASYPGIRDYFLKREFNTLVLAVNSHPAMIGGENGDEQKRENHQIINYVRKRSDVDIVIIINRGMINFTGFEPTSLNKISNPKPLMTKNTYFSSLQNTIDLLNNSGKKVYVVSENPELNFFPKNCVSRPFKLTINDCEVNYKEVIQRQADYLSEIKKMKGATIFFSIDIFCEDKKCGIFDKKKQLLYMDDDHISVAGSKFLADYIGPKILQDILKSNKE
jgi:peptidoglycan/LPS O-acetylase OafA/YrhL